VQNKFPENIFLTIIFQENALTETLHGGAPTRQRGFAA
jgi:hypothetical protein